MAERISSVFERVSLSFPLGRGLACFMLSKRGNHEEENMIDHPIGGSTSRRDFIKLVTASGAALCLGNLKGRAAAGAFFPPPALDAPAFQYRTISVGRLTEVKKWFEKLDKDGRLSRQPIFRKYVDSFHYAPPKDLPEAKSLIIISLPDWISTIAFHHRGVARDLLVSCGYVDFGPPEETIKKWVSADIIKDPSARFVSASKLPLKTLAALSGLAAYGKNNITYVEGYGSCHALYAYFTDKGLPDQWGPLRMLRQCKGCRICAAACPTKAIRDSEFVIDAGKCLCLYYELKDPLPAWIDPSAYHALAGCFDCQYTCPANRAQLKAIRKIADISEEETELLMSGGTDAALRASIAGKLKAVPALTNFDYLARNFRLAWANAAKS